MVTQGSHMLCRAIALVALPAILGMRVRRCQHDPVAPLLGDNRGGGNCRFDPVAANNGPRSPGPFGNATMRREIAVDQYLSRGFAKCACQGCHSAGHGEHGRIENVDPIDFLGFCDSYSPAARGTDRLVQHRAATCGKFLGIIKTCGYLMAQHHSSGHNRPCQWSPSCLVHADDNAVGTERVLVSYP